MVGPGSEPFCKGDITLTRSSSHIQSVLFPNKHNEASNPKSKGVFINDKATFLMNFQSNKEELERLTLFFNQCAAGNDSISPSKNIYHVYELRVHTRRAGFIQM